MYTDHYESLHKIRSDPFDPCTDFSLQNYNNETYNVTTTIRHISPRPRSSNHDRHLHDRRAFVRANTQTPKYQTRVRQLLDPGHGLESPATARLRRQAQGRHSAVF